MKTHNKTVKIKQHDLNHMQHTINKLLDKVDSLTWRVKAERMSMHEGCEGCPVLLDLGSEKSGICDCNSIEHLTYG
jgi:hypothetical protein